MTQNHSSQYRSYVVYGVCIAVFLLLGIAAGSGAVTAAPESAVNVSSTPAEPVQPGETFTFDISMTNTGDENGTVTDIRVQDEPEGVTATDPPLQIRGLTPEETVTETVSVSVGDNVSSGEYTLTAYGAVAEGQTDTTHVNFTVDTRSSLNVSLNPAVVTANETTNVSVTVTDAASGMPVTNANITRLATVETISVDQKGTAIIQVSPSEPGEIIIDVTAAGYRSTTKNITVNEGQTEVARFDADNDGIDRGDAVRAVVAYNTGSDVGGTKVTRQEAVRVIIAYITGQ